MIGTLLFTFALLGRRTQAEAASAGITADRVDWGQFRVIARFLDLEKVPYDGNPSEFHPMRMDEEVPYYLILKGKPREVDRTISLLQGQFGISIIRKGTKAVVRTSWPEFSFVPDHALSSEEFLARFEPGSLAAEGFKSQVQTELHEGDRILTFRYTMHPYLTAAMKLTQAIDGELEIRRPTKSFYQWLELRMYYPTN